MLVRKRFFSFFFLLKLGEKSGGGGGGGGGNLKDLKFHILLPCMLRVEERYKLRESLGIGRFSTRLLPRAAAARCTVLVTHSSDNAWLLWLQSQQSENTLMVLEVKVMNGIDVCPPPPPPPCLGTLHITSSRGNSGHLINNVLAVTVTCVLPPRYPLYSIRSWEKFELPSYCRTDRGYLVRKSSASLLPPCILVSPLSITGG